MVFGRKPEASDEGAGPLEHPKPPLAADPGRFRQVTDVAWDSRRQHLHQRRLHQFARRQGRQGRQLDQIVGRAAARAGPVQHAACDRDRPQGTSTSPIAAITVSRYSTTTGKVLTPDHDRRAGAGRRQAGDRQHPERGADQPGEHVHAGLAVGHLHHAGAEPGALRRGRLPGRIYKLTLDGKVLGMLGESGKQLKQFGWIHELACPSENVLWVGELLNWRAQKLVLHP